MVLVHNIIKLVLITVFLSTSVMYADDSDRRDSVVRSANGNILAEILDIVYNLGVDLGTAIKIYLRKD